MSFDNPGLRRRSPNPNSPLPQLEIPYSPALLSPYIHVNGDGRGLGLGYNDVFDRYHRPSPLVQAGHYPSPTIRLIPSSYNQPHSPIQATRHAPPTARSRSNDEIRAISDQTAASIAALRRHRTDPRNYSNGERAARGESYESTLFPRDSRDRPVPPLPLDIKRTKRGPPSISSSTSTGKETGESTLGPISPVTPYESRPHSVMSSLKSLRNPFVRRAGSAASSSPTMSTRSSSSLSSISTLAVPFYPSAFWRGESGLDNVSSRDVFGYGVAGLTWALLILGRDSDIVIYDATYSKKCYPRTTLPGCKSKWIRQERKILHDFSTAAFSVLGFHFVNIVIALLSSNHVNSTFGKGLTPLSYRLGIADVRANAVAVLSTLPQSKSDKSPLLRHPAMSHKTRPESPHPRPVCRASVSSWDTVWNGVLHEAGPRGRALREARERGLL
ncbi:uncharacterized protein IL334_001229 [Kwoniella shivajii]|uniref:Uncharacterized protein n=1 Tax=Kwoniella shivajii TaxID=564305 RepID=A0ABZ1CRC0_9TREE|nr:hypothetical protein IL334_001229 [Kwoniella shivajii]